MTEHGEGPRPPFDPFENHLRFVAPPGRQSLSPDRPPLSSFEPMDAGAVRMIDPEALEARRSWQGTVAVHREQEPSEYPSEMTDAMQICEPQFILRNLGRVERWGETDEALGLEALEVPYGLPPTPEGRLLDFEPAVPDLKLSIERLVERRREDRWLFRELPWETRFCRELKESLSGPLWRYIPGEEEEEE